MGNAIRNCLEQRAGSHQRLYFLDGTFPGDLPGHFQSYEDVPGQHLSLGCVTPSAQCAHFCIRLTEQARLYQAAEWIEAAALQPLLLKPSCHVSAMEAPVAPLQRQLQRGAASSRSMACVDCTCASIYIVVLVSNAL